MTRQTRAVLVGSAVLLAAVIGAGSCGEKPQCSSDADCPENAYCDTSLKVCFTGTPDGGCATACATGQRCSNGSCVCDSESCPGCCAGDVCRDGDEASACGNGGAACSVCTSPDECLDGVCSACRSSCANGCCQGAVCKPASMETCGVSGESCVACDPMRSDSCNAAGDCACGSGAECAAGLRCVAGTCVCDAESCATGCCDGTMCKTPSVAACGTGGGACTACDPLAVDSCTDGQCRCGSGGSCAAGQRCSGGQCVCDSTSCPAGCCSGNTCQINQLASCGSAGAACSVCNSQLADSCNQGECLCGSGPACVTGQRCVGGQCICDAVSCPAGCCQGNACAALIHPTCAPSDGGNSCVQCSSVTSDRCASTGGCACGTNRYGCPPGTYCSNAECVCDSTGCPGCCVDQRTCLVTATASQCGKNGSPCTACSFSQQCINGACQ